MKKKDKTKIKKPANPASSREARQRAFVYKPLFDGDIRFGRGNAEFKGPGYEVFNSIKWNEAWKMFLEVDEKGIYKYKTAYALAKELAKGTNTKSKENKDRVKYIYAAIGPKEEAAKKLCPYVGDWDHMRSSLFVGDQDKQSILFGNPQIAALRKVVGEYLDVTQVAKGVGDIWIEWIARYSSWADQLDRYFQYKAFDPTLDIDENEKRFEKYAKMQRYVFNEMKRTSRELLRCYGVGENDIAMLTQLMIATMRGKIGEATAAMMLAASTGTQIEGNVRPMAGEVGPGTDAEKVDAISKGFNDNPTLRLAFGTFLEKAATYKMEFPGVTIPGVPPEDKSIDPSTSKVKTKSKEVSTQ